MESQSNMPGRYAPGYTPPHPDPGLGRMTKAEARRAKKQAKLDHKKAFDAGQMKTVNELNKRIKQLNTISKA
jgi:hypothetical protein